QSPFVSPARPAREMDEPGTAGSGGGRLGTGEGQKFLHNGQCAGSAATSRHLHLHVQYFAYSIGEGSGMGRSGGGIPDQKDGGAAGRGRVFAGIRFLVEVRG